jgi:hypothetical protein
MPGCKTRLADVMSTYADQLALQIQAFGLTALSQICAKSRAYYENKPYPTYGDWPYDENNQQKYPKVVVPLPKIIVNKSATFMMKRRPRLFVPNNQQATDFIKQVIDYNELDMLSISKVGGIEGGVWLMFYYDGAQKFPWQVVVHSVEEIYPTYDAHDQRKLLKLRVQYKFVGNDGLLYWHREEWTADTYKLYQDLPTSLYDSKEVNEHSRVGLLADSAYTSPWKVAVQTPNYFGVIPAQHIRNVVDPLNPKGMGDYWDLFTLFDRINVAYENMDQSNQFAGGPVPVFKEVDEAPRELVPHNAISITGPNADAELLEPSGQLRQHIEWYADKLESFAYSAAQIVNPKLEDVAGLGQLSYAALQLLHGPLVELTDAKRPYWGKWGLCAFFEKMLYAASRLGSGERIEGGEDAVVDIEWPDYFPMGGVDKQIEIANIIAAKQIGLPIQDSVIWLAKVIGVSEEEMPEFLKRAEADAEAMQKLQEATALLKQVAIGNSKPGLQNQAADGSVKGAARSNA